MAEAKIHNKSGKYISNPFIVIIESFKALPTNLRTLLGLYGLMLVAIIPVFIAIGAAIAVSSRGGKPQITAGLVVLLLLMVILVFIVQAAYMAYIIKTARGELIGIKEALRVGLEKALPLLGQSVVMSILIVVGLILLIVPGIILAYRFFFAPYVLVDQNVGIFEALKRSRQLVKGKAAELGGLIGANLLVVL